MFQVVAVPFDAYQSLPTPAHRWLMTCLARYVDRSGQCWPTMRQLAADARLSLSTVCRRLAEMATLGVFQRSRQGVGRYRYQIAKAYLPHWPGRAKNEANPSVSPRVKHGVSQRGTQEANPSKQIEERDPELFKWRGRIRQFRDCGQWVAKFGPKPGRPGCEAPAEALAAFGYEVMLQGA